MRPVYFEDFTVGRKFLVPAVEVVADDMRQFAERYDPQPIHMDDDWANNQMFGGVIASGFYTMALMWSQWIRQEYFGRDIIGGTGLSDVRWLGPVRAGDRLSAVATVTDARASSKPGRGTVTLEFIITNQDHREVLRMRGTVLLKSASDNL